MENAKDSTTAVETNDSDQESDALMVQIRYTIGKLLTAIEDYNEIQTTGLSDALKVRVSIAQKTAVRTAAINVSASATAWALHGASTVVAPTPKRGRPRNE